MMDGLTEAQQTAVDHVEGPLMVLAGPGSGKTRVITYRIANLLRHGVTPDQILALTFTNKAAREMSDRVQKLLGGTRVLVSTFHRFCARLLRRWPESVGLKENFTILDHGDQVQLVRGIMKDAGLDSVFHDPSRVLARISRCRNYLMSAEDFQRQFEERVGDPLDAIVFQVFAEYEQRVLNQNSVDFDDLLLHVVRLLRDDQDMRGFLDAQFRFVLVDEYQDTNLAQYEIVKSISQQFPNLCATGDPDQSIYGWRGARPENLSNFERDFPDVRVVSLDQNFRSTQSIVRCADQLISNNPRRHRGQLTTCNPNGQTVRLAVYDTGDVEADGVAKEIAERVAAGERRFSDFAVFYRVNALSRPLETAFSRHQVPFQVAAGYSFYERAEIRDLIAYLRLIENHADNSAMQRIINRPIRGIGARSLQRVVNHAEKHNLTLFEAACQAEQISSLTTRAVKPIQGFTDLIQRLHQLSAEGRVAPVLERLIADIDYLKIWKEESEAIDVDRLANVHELISAARQYDAACDSEDSEPPSLQGFLEQACLSSEVDNVDAANGAVTLMTMHAAKGLEFPVVFIIGLENSLIPHERAVRNGDPRSFEEERRLLFVGITRAMEELTLTQTIERTFRGSRRTTIASPFISEIETTIQRQFAEPEQAQRISAASIDHKLAEARKRFETAKLRSDRPLLMTGSQLAAARDAAAQDGHSDGYRIAEHPSAKLTADNSADDGSSTTLPEPSSVAKAALPAALFRQGMRVRHPRYGLGVVVAVSAATSRGTITVQFEKDGRSETFVAARCPLQPIGL